MLYHTGVSSYTQIKYKAVSISTQLIVEMVVVSIEVGADINRMKNLPLSSHSVL